MAAEAPFKPLQVHQVTRIRQEEEDSWISGEELYTEGSSDDEAGGHSHSHLRTSAHLPHAHTNPPKCPQSPPAASPPSAASEPAQQTDPHMSETTRRLSLMGLENVESRTQHPPAASDSDEVEEQEEVMLWRPKRGSIKLPHIDLDPPSSSLLEQVSG